MFPTQLYIERRESLRRKISNGLILFLGNTDIPYNYRSNTYHFRQDSTFSYFFGLHQPDLAGIIDLEEGSELIFGNDIDIEDIIWMGNLPSIKERAAKAGIAKVLPMQELDRVIKKAMATGRKIHFLPPYRSENILQITSLLGKVGEEQKKDASRELIKAVIELRSVKNDLEVEAIEKMVDVAWLMHTTAMKMARPGVIEKEIAGTIEGIALSHGNGVSFPVILSQHGETLHNHSHANILEKGKLMLTDAGSESALLYASDITRTVPVGGKFSSQQKDIYQIVLEANLNTIQMANPLITYMEVHLAASKIIAYGLKGLGLMRGRVDDAIEAGAHALFFPHGLGHMLGLDVHDMENLGENLVGYESSDFRSGQFGLAYLRFAKKPKPGYVLTDEPGIYFIPELIDLWRKENKFTEFINYDKVETHKGFGGIRIEDDILVTEVGCRVLGKPIPKTVEQIEEIMNE
jgi:Xaa-Pro aminopeptidase